ncbi:glutathione S-transferase family protein [Tianweitania sp. BSSL-BM11]|uniref:Glutathione S-transferase family protein n=1 Tax=Tianweitania aestuarii TaxID=2814886 RepID=A0ABS5RS15_9HYPH|nr:glutathione S-transferase family protein [Tianweitania aestuarii]MBS9719838.1 glutathione S-transferase family protein [Tianweitania aestuarii]
MNTLLHGRATSSNVQIVAWALTELGLSYERLDVGGAFGGNTTPEFKALNPNGLVPVLEIDGLTLWESGAITRYLGARYGDEAFWPADPAVRAPVDKWAEWIKTTFVPAFLGGVFWPIISTKPGQPLPDSFAAAAAKLKQVAAILETGMPEDGFFGGDTVCWADMVIGTYLFRYFDLDFDRAETPKLRAYYDRLTGRPAYAEHVMVNYDSLRAK